MRKTFAQSALLILTFILSAAFANAVLAKTTVDDLVFGNTKTNILEILAPQATVTIVNYDFNTSPCTAAPAATAPNVSSTFTTSSTAASPTTACASGTGVATTGTAFAANAAGTAPSLNGLASTSAVAYFQFQLGGSALNTYSGYKIYFQTIRSSTGPPNGVIQYSTDGVNFTNFTTFTVPTSFNAFTFDLSAVAALNNASTVYFRVASSGATGTSGTFRLDNFQVQASNSAAATPTVSLAITPSTGSETAQTTFTATVTASAPVSGNQTVNFALTGGTATTADFAGIPATITILSGQTTGTATFTVVDDTLVEGNETGTFTITPTTSGISSGSPTTASVTITDNDAAPATDLTITQSGSATAPVNGTVTYTLVVANSGAAVNTAFDATFVLPDGVANAVVVNDGCFTGSSISGSTVTFTGCAALGTNATSTLIVTVTPTAAGTLTSGLATVDSGNTITESNETNNTAAGVSTTINPPISVVINEIYGAGGNAGASFNADYIELYNNGTTAADLTGYSLQYASATGTFSGVIVLPGVSIPAGGFFLVQTNTAGANGSPISPDFISPNAVELATSNGNVALVAGTTAIGACPAPGAANVIDRVGYGTGACSEVAPAPAPSTTTSVQRFPNGSDTNNNSVDFQATAGTPKTANRAATNGTIQFSSATYAVTEGTATVTITVTRTGGSDGAVSASYATSNGTADGGAACTTAGVDYISKTGTVTFGAGSSTSQTFTISICDDAAVENSETVNFTLSSPTGGATLGTQNTAVLTIADNDVAPTTAPTITSGSSTTFTQGTAGSFQVTATGNPAPTFSVTSGTLPTGVTLSSSGLLSGTPTQSGTFTFTIRATNSAGAANQTFTLTVNTPPDTTAPDTTITAAPPASGNQSNVSFSFTGTDNVGVTSFECSIDGGATFAACTSPQNYTLADGTYTFMVRALDAAGNKDQTPAAFTFTIDTGAPTVVSIATASPNPTTSGSNVSYTVTFSEAVTGVDASDFVLTTTGVTGASITSVTGSGTTYTVTVNTGTGTGTVRLDISDNDSIVDAVNNPLGGAGAGNGSAQGQVYTVNAPTNAPTITSANNAAFTIGTFGTFTVTTTGTPTPTITVSGALPAGVTFTNNGDGTATLSGTPAAGTQGTYTLTFTASNGAGSDAMQTFTLTVSAAPDTTAPDTTIDSAPPNPSNSRSATFTFSGTDNVGVTNFECSLDGAAFTSCASGITYTNLADGSHTFQVRALDAAGNFDQTPATFTFTVDATAPSVQSIAAASANPTTSGNTVNYTVTFSEAVTGVDAGDFALTTTGVSGASIAGVSGSGATYTVSVNVGTGAGAVRLDLIDDDSIIDAANNPLGGTGAGNGNFTAGDTYTVNAAPSAGTIQFGQPTYSTGESGAATITVTRSGGTSGAVTVDYTISDGTATGGSTCTGTGNPDFTVSGVGTVTFASGSDRATFNVPICADSIAEGDESFTIQLSNPTGGAALGTTTTATVTIIDDDAAGFTVTPTALNVTEGGAAATYQVSLTSQPTSDVIITISANSQLTVSSTTLTFTPLNYNTPQTVTVSANSDATAQGSRTVTITQTAASGDGRYNNAAVPGVSVTITDANSPIVTLAQPACGGIAGNPITAGSPNRALLCFSLASNASAANFTALQVPFSTSGDLSGVFGNVRLVQSVDNDYATTGDNTVVAAGTVSTNSFQFSGFNLPLQTAAGTAINFFVAADVSPTVKTTTPAAQPSVSPANVTVTGAAVSGTTATGQNFTFAPTAPTPASVTIGGRVVNSNGRGIARARITMTDGQGNVRWAMTNSFGYYRFADVEVGQTVVFAASAKGVSFTQTTQAVTVSESRQAVNFTAN